MKKCDGYLAKWIGHTREYTHPDTYLGKGLELFSKTVQIMSFSILLRLNNTNELVVFP